MKKVFLSLLAVIVVLGLFTAAGYTGYRVGYVQGARSKTITNSAPSNPALRPFNGFGPRQMPRSHVERGFRGGMPRMGFGFFSPLAALARLLVLFGVFVLVVWFIYWLISRSGWRLTRQPVETRPPAETQRATEANPAKPENE